MPYLMNCTQDEVVVKAAGNYFTFKPGQIKPMSNPDIAHFIATDKRESGIVLLPNEFEEDAEYRNTEAGKAKIAELKEEGLKNFLDGHRKTVYNAQVSMRRDLERAGFKHDPMTEVSNGELASMRILAKYARAEQDIEAQRAEEAKKLLEQIKKANK